MQAKTNHRCLTGCGNERNYGIDLLRIFCIFGVVVLHILGHGNVLQTTASGVGFSTAWFLEILAYPAVNCFVLISGFVGYRRNQFYPKLKNIIYLFFTVLFYSVFICLCFKMIYPEQIGLISIAKAFLPITTNQYWFFSSYFAMFLVSPMLNLFIYKADSKMTVFTILVVLILSVSSIITDPFNLDGGYGFIWFAILYVLGAIIKKTDFINKISIPKSVLLFSGAFLITWVLKVVCGLVSFEFFGLPFSKFADILVSYSSPSILVMAIALLCIFAKIKTSTNLNKAVSFLTPSVFSVYLIHDNVYFRSFIISNRFEFANNYNPLVMILIILSVAALIFAVCVFVDKIRIWLFKALHIDSLFELPEIIIKRIVIWFQTNTPNS